MPAAFIARHAPPAEVLTDFVRELEEGRPQTPYPLERVRQLTAG